jgi:cation diffusion facilitator family transporter
MRPQVVIAATILINIVLFAVNLAVAELSGSQAIFSQAIYIVADLLAAGMVFWGQVAAQRPPDATHPFGRGKERFFWAFAATLVTFSLAGLFVLTEGFGAIATPTTLSNFGAQFAVTIATLVSSIAGIWVALRELRRGRETVTSLIESPNVGLKTIFYQDVVTVISAGIVFLGVAASARSQDSIYDGLASVAVGVLLIITGFILAAESRELLVGRAIPPAHARGILQIVEQDARVKRVRTLQSMMLGPEDGLVALRVNFRDGLTTDELERAIDDLAGAIRRTYPVARHLVIEPES